ncbi:heptaprenylglyceryl phosphate synthase [Marinithermofilum abyssi]|uniref:Heptaprenylglyceryl phosphate synthase n=1 Tax=Marinithermofilum abyssi TaxID=1571185 RepID=A0A8J2YDF0_9BACL|nr:heptaprenylglyceryl phosphate synthase [Marinithermofilum abyssi]GGE09656.1 heptaprenylglyceryl phosphate synthase [Marinithermofilum abyssi]
MLEERMRRWRHVFKLDPNRPISDEALAAVAESGTDAVIIGGTDGITYENTRELWERVSRFPVPCVQEISSTDAVVPSCEGHLIPVVLNARETEWLGGAQHRAIKLFGDWIPWEQIAVLGYVVLNPDSKVARLTRSRTELQPADMTAYIRLAERLFRLPAAYVEYSGTYGEPAMVEAARRGKKDVQLFYGGGISTQEQAETMARLADTVVVGNLIYENLEQALQTVRWVKEPSGGKSTQT